MEEFVAADLVRSVGIADAGSELVDVYNGQMPPQLAAALQMRVNDKLEAELTPSSYEAIARIAGQKIEGATVRGGERSPHDAWVVYVHFDRRGTPMKGCFPYRDLSRGETGELYSQAAAIAKAIENTEAARALAIERAAERGVLAEKDAQIAALEAELKQRPDSEEAVRAAERERAAAEARAAAERAAAEAAERAARAEKEAEALRQRLAELEAEREKATHVDAGEQPSTEAPAKPDRPARRRSGR